MRPVALSVALLLTVLGLSCATAPKKDETAAAPAASARLEVSHRWCLLTQFDVGKAASELETSCTLEAAGEAENPRAMHLDIGVRIAGQEAETPALSLFDASLCVTHQRKYVEVCVPDDQAANTLKSLGMESLDQVFGQAVTGVLHRVFHAPVLTTRVAGLAWPLQVAWPHPVSYSTRQSFEDGRFDRLENEPLLVEPMVYLVMAAPNAADELEPVSCTVTDQASGAVLNPGGGFSLAFSAGDQGRSLSLERPGYETAVLSVQGGQITAPQPGLIVEQVVLNSMERIYLVAMKQAVARPRRDPRGR